MTEAAEVVGRRDERGHHHHPQRDLAEHDELAQVLAAPRISARIATTCATILILPSGDAGIDDAARVGEAAQRRDRELAADDHRHHPRRREIHLHQRDERRR